MLTAITGPEPRPPGPGIDAPAYRPIAAARHLRLPVSSLRWWTLGNGEHLPVIHIADRDEHLLSFRNLVEVHVLSAVMRHDRSRVPLAAARASLALVAERFRSEHPLSDARMEGEGKELFAARFGELVNASRPGQAAIASILASYLQRVQRDEQGEPRRLILFTRGHPEGPEHVVIDPMVCGGEPCIAGTALPTAAVAQRFKDGASVSDLAHACRCQTEEIEEAIRYESSAP